MGGGMLHFPFHSPLSILFFSKSKSSLQCAHRKYSMEGDGSYSVGIVSGPCTPSVKAATYAPHLSVAGVELASTALVSPGVWHFVTASYNASGGMMVCLDKTCTEGPAPVNALSTATQAQTTTLAIGGVCLSNAGVFNGAIDDIRICDTAWTQQEVTDTIDTTTIIPKVISYSPPQLSWEGQQDFKIKGQFPVGALIRIYVGSAECAVTTDTTADTIVCMGGYQWQPRPVENADYERVTTLTVIVDGKAVDCAGGPCTVSIVGQKTTDPQFSVYHFQELSNGDHSREVTNYIDWTAVGGSPMGLVWTTFF